MIKHYFSAILFILLVQMAAAQAPVINSFAPASGPVGTAVTITGTNFRAIPANNTVYFGAVKANVTAASSTQLTVTVPTGATYVPITVKTDSLTAYSARPFIVTFGDISGANFTGNSFLAKQKITDGYKPCFGDFDNDGLVDMATFINGNKISIFKNIGSVTQFAFAAGIEYATITSPYQMIAADLNGDGKLDLALVNTTSTAFAFHINSSSNDNISFSAVQYKTVSGSFVPSSIAANDIDGDGKTDLIFGYNGTSRAFGVARNTGTGGSIAFATAVTTPFGTIPGAAGNVFSNNRVFAADIDGDKKPDITIVNSSVRQILFYRNTITVPGTISFSGNTVIESGRPGGSTNFESYNLALGDLDADNKLDIVYFGDSTRINLFRNTSSIGTISFAARVSNDIKSYPECIAIADMDGDAKPDIVTIGDYDSVRIIKNKSIPGNIISEIQGGYYIGATVYSINAADLDADGKADIIISNNENNFTYKTSSVLRNQVKGPVINSVLPITAAKGDTVTIKGDRFTNTTNINFGDSAAANFTVVSDSVITAVVGNGATGILTVTTTSGIAKYDGFTFSQPIPFIYYFAPTAGPVGTPVIIHGKNFNPVVENNIVYFGSGRAAVTAATDSTLTVTAPAYNSYLPISVHNNGTNLTAYSKIPFNTTFDANVNAFSNANFTDTVSYATPSEAVTCATADFDEDGRPDIASSIYYNYSGVSVYKNISSNKKCQFIKRADYATYGASPGGNATGVVYSTTTDVDGDGRLDMAAISNGIYLLSVFRNKSTADSIDFETKIDFNTGYNPTSVTAADLDNDGKPEMAVTNAVPGTISILRNLSSPGNLKFISLPEIPSGSAPQHILLEDFDNDGKKDMAVTNYNNNNISLFRNISSTGTIAFDSKTSVPTGTGPVYVSAGDLNADGKIDMVITNQVDKSISVYKNISTTGNILFAVKTDYTIPDYPRGVTIADLDGDGRPDIIAGNNSNTSGSVGNISLFKNLSTGDSITLAPKFDIKKTSTPTDVFTTDVNGDGKPELIVSTAAKRISIVRNAIGDPVPVSVCPDADSMVFSAGLTGNSYQWQLNSGNGFENISNDINHSGTDSSILVLKNIPSSWYGYQYRCVVDGRSSDIRELKITATWLGGTGSNWENPANWGCSHIPDENTDVIINFGNIQVNSNVSIRSIRIKTPANIIVNNGYTFSVLQ